MEYQRSTSNHVFTIHYSPPEDPNAPVADNVDSVERFESIESFDLTGQLSRISSAPTFLGTYSFVHREYLKGEMVAVKVLRLASDDVASMRRKVRREREVWASLAHPNILPFYGFASDPVFGDFGALISPWCRAGDTDQFLRTHGTSMTPKDRIQFWKGVVSGVHYLHTRTPIVIHGDIKPGNVLVDDYGSPRLCDFGLVRIIIDGDAEIGMTPTSKHTGTPRYLAIELLKNEKARPTIASDVHALGCLGLEVIFSRKPHAQRKNNLRGGVIQDIKRGLPPAIRDDNLNLSEGCAWSLLEQYWRLEPSSRPLTQAILAGAETLLFHNHGSPLRDIHVEETSDFIGRFLELWRILRYRVETSDCINLFLLFWLIGKIVRFTQAELMRSEQLVYEKMWEWRRLLQMFSMISLRSLFCLMGDFIMFPRNYDFGPTTLGLSIADLVTILYDRKKSKMPLVLDPDASAFLETLLLAVTSCSVIVFIIIPLEFEPYPRESTSSKIGSKCPLFRHGSLRQQQMSRVVAAANPLLLYLAFNLVFSAFNLLALIINLKLGVATSITTFGLIYHEVARGRLRAYLLDFIEACVDGTPPQEFQGSGP